MNPWYAKYSQVAIRWPNGFVASLRAAHEASGESLAGYVRKTIEERMARDGFEMPKGEETSRDEANE